jgi:hypothetical protein
MASSFTPTIPALVAQYEIVPFAPSSIATVSPPSGDWAGRRN